MNHADQHKVFRLTREARGRISGDGVELAFGYWPGRGAPVIAIHGLTATYISYIGVAERLAGRRPLFGVDLRGRGDSDKPEGPYGMAQHARDVAAAMQTLGLGPCVIVGHSMGAFVAAALAAQNPELVSGIIMIDGGYVPDLPVGVDSSQMLDATLALRISQLTRTYDSRSAFLEFWRSQPNFPAEEWNSWTEAFLDYEVAGDTTVQPKASASAVRVDVAEAFKRDEIIARLKSLHVPVLLLRAERGLEPKQPPIYPDSVMPMFRECIPGMKEELVCGTTHFTITLGERGASRVADLIVDFAETCEKP
ncbi:MAG TPA: alpha/beta hydrolase [Pyrinomonadaceae bacterium]|nr:alpha/beta hydrolase [Pyrinomonadaceae bacterium]